MATWDQIVEYIKESYSAEQDEEGGFFTLTYTFDDERTQVLFVDAYENSGVHWLQLQSGVCKQDELGFEDALRRNADIGVGSLILEGDQYYLLYAIPVEFLADTDTFDVLLAYVAAMADSLEAEITGGGDAS